MASGISISHPAAIDDCLCSSFSLSLDSSESAKESCASALLACFSLGLVSRVRGVRQVSIISLQMWRSEWRRNASVGKGMTWGEEV